VADHAAVRGNDAAQVGEDPGDRRFAVRHDARDGGPAERRPAGALLVLADELPHLVDGRDAVHVALVLRGAPREEPVASEDDAVTAGRRGHRLAQHQRELEAGTLPGDPDDAAPVLPVELLELARPVRARRERDRPVRVQVIDVRKRQKRVQRRVD
jgi:hypothetical protein